MRPHSEILCIFQKAKQILKELYFAQELHFRLPSLPVWKKKRGCLFSSSSYNLLPPQRQKGDLWQLSQACIIITLLQGSERPETFSKWDTLKFIVPRQWHECTVHLPLIYQRMSTTPSFICIHLQKQSRLTEAASACRLLLNGESKRRFTRTDVHMWQSACKSCPSSKSVTLMLRKCWGKFLFGSTKLQRREEMCFHLLFPPLFCKCFFFPFLFFSTIKISFKEAILFDLQPLSFSPAVVGELANKMLGFNLTTKQTPKEGVKVKTVRNCRDGGKLFIFFLPHFKSFWVQ